MHSDEFIALHQFFIKNFSQNIWKIENYFSIFVISK